MLPTGHSRHEQSTRQTQYRSSETYSIFFIHVVSQFLGFTWKGEQKTGKRHLILGPGPCGDVDALREHTLCLEGWICNFASCDISQFSNVKIRSARISKQNNTGPLLIDRIRIDLLCKIKPHFLVFSSLFTLLGAALRVVDFFFFYKKIRYFAFSTQKFTCYIVATDIYIIKICVYINKIIILLKNLIIDPCIYIESFILLHVF